MFDIGFWELLVVAVIALIVVGPDRLPGLVRTTGRWLGRARHYAGVLRDEFEREAQRAEELKELAQMRIELEERERAEAAKRPTVPVNGRPESEETQKPLPSAGETTPQQPAAQPMDTLARPAEQREREAAVKPRR